MLYNNRIAPILQFGQFCPNATYPGFRFLNMNIAVRVEATLCVLLDRRLCVTTMTHSPATTSIATVFSMTAEKNGRCLLEAYRIEIAMPIMWILMVYREGVQSSQSQGLRYIKYSLVDI